MRTRTIYIAEDGKEFDNEHDCRLHEKYLILVKETEEREACEAFFLSIGIDLSTYKTELERNQAIGLAYLVFDKHANVKGIKTVGGGLKKRYGIECDFVYATSSADEPEALENWLKENKLYAHALSSFLNRNKAFYEMPLIDKLKNLCWEVENGELKG